MRAFGVWWIVGPVVDVTEVENPIDVIEQAVVVLARPGLLPGGELQGVLMAWFAELADEAREHEALLGEVRFPAPQALLSVTYRNPVAVAKAVLALALARA